MKKIYKNKNARRHIRTMGEKEYKKVLSRREKVSFIDSLLQSGKMVGINWLSKDGISKKGCFTKKNMVLNGGQNTLRNFPQYLTRVDINRKDKKTGERGRFTAINLDGIQEIRANKKVYCF